MKRSSFFLTVGILMLAAAAGFVLFALNHPEMSFVWPNSVTYTIYLIYFAVMLVMFALSVYYRKKK